MTGVCTAPSLVRAKESSAVSSRVGSCQATTLPGRTPSPYRPAATRSHRSRSSPKVRTRSSWIDLCCALRKVRPLEQGLTAYTAWATGLRRDESPTRANTPVVGWDEKRQKVKISPIARWSQEDVETYIAEHGVLTNPLLMDGYASVGCAPCTRRVLEGEDPRAGRWAGRAKTECGLHG